MRESAVPLSFNVCNFGQLDRTADPFPISRQAVDLPLNLRFRWAKKNLLWSLVSWNQLHDTDRARTGWSLTRARDASLHGRVSSEKKVTTLTLLLPHVIRMLTFRTLLRVPRRRSFRTGIALSFLTDFFRPSGVSLT